MAMEASWGLVCLDTSLINKEGGRDVNAEIGVPVTGPTGPKTARAGGVTEGLVAQNVSSPGNKRITRPLWDVWLIPACVPDSVIDTPACLGGDGISYIRAKLSRHQLVSRSHSRAADKQSDAISSRLRKWGTRPAQGGLTILSR